MRRQVRALHVRAHTHAHKHEQVARRAQSICDALRVRTLSPPTHYYGRLIRRYFYRVAAVVVRVVAIEPKAH